MEDMDLMDKQYLDDFIQPIFDRTIEDVTLLNNLLLKGYANFSEEEKTLWESDLKGALNVSDINRIENNIYILGLCLGLSIDKKTYSELDIPTEDNFSRIYDNLSLIRSNILNLVDYIPQVPERPYNTIEKLNNIEHLTSEIYNIIKNS